MSEQTVKWEEEKNKLIFQRDRLKAQFSCAFQWLELLEDKTDLQPYLTDHKCSKVAIYGAAEIGRILLKEIEQNNVTRVSFFLDRNAERQRVKWGVPVYLPEEYMSLPDVDMVIVTAMLSLQPIQDSLLRIRPEIPVVSLEMIVGVRKDEVWYDGR